MYSLLMFLLYFVTSHPQAVQGKGKIFRCRIQQWLLLWCRLRVFSQALQPLLDGLDPLG